jgi:hypothetical protein
MKYLKLLGCTGLLVATLVLTGCSGGGSKSSGAGGGSGTIGPRPAPGIGVGLDTRK